MRCRFSNSAFIGLGLLLVLGLGCGTEYKEQRNASLGDVVKEAGKEPDEERTAGPDTARLRFKGVVTEGEEPAAEQQPIVAETSIEKTGHFETEITEISEGEVDELSSAQPPESGGDGEPFGWYLGAIGGGGSVTGDNVTGFAVGGLTLGSTIKHGKARLEAQGLVGTANMKDESDLAHGLKNEFTVGWGFAGQYLLTPAHTGMGLYALGGIRGVYLFWDYQNPVEVESDVGSETVEADILKYTDLYAGLGVSLARLRYAEIGVNVSGGFRFYSDVTNEGFENDLLSDEAFFQVLFDIVFGKMRTEPE